MADQRRIARIIAPASAPVCQIFVGSRRSRRVTAFSLRGQDALGTAGGTPALRCLLALFFFFLFVSEVEAEGGVVALAGNLNRQLGLSVFAEKGIDDL